MGLAAVFAVAGAGAGGGLWLALSGLFPGRPGLAETLAAMDWEPTPPQPRAESLDEWTGRLVVRLLGPGRVRPGADRRPDLALLDKSEATHVGSQLTSALAATLAGPAIAMAVGVVGVGVRWQFPAMLAVALGAAGWLLPDFDVRLKAAKRRRAVRRELCGFLDIVSLELASGELIGGAVEKAARAGDGVVYRLLRLILADAAQRHVAPWDAVAAAGEERGLEELTALAASMRAAGGNGARVRETLSAKAASLRVQTLTDMQAEANAATAKMIVPLAGFTTGFMLLALYPSIARIMTGT